jgi:hypothetical protein
LASAFSASALPPPRMVGGGDRWGREGRVGPGWDSIRFDGGTQLL